MKYDEAKLYLEHTSYDDFNLEEHQINNRLEAIKVVLEENERLKRQQKEFIKYLEEEILKNTPKARWKHYNEDGFNDYDVCFDYIENQPVNVTLKEILLIYKEIIGDVEDDKSN